MTETPLAKTALKFFVSAITLFYGFLPALADLNETHLFNPLWSEHARFHTAWFLAFTAGVSLTALYMIWRKADVFLPIVLSLMFAGGFWVATLFRDAYGGGLVDSNGHTHTIVGTESNTFVFTVVSLLLIAALVAALRTHRSSIRHG